MDFNFFSPQRPQRSRRIFKFFVIFVAFVVKKILFIFLFLPFFLQAITQDEVLQKYEVGKILFETEQYQEAQNIFDTLSKEEIPSWQKQIFQYNVGTSLLAEKKWDEALAQFNQIIPDNDPNPLFLYNLDYNKAYALFHAATDPFQLKEALQLLEAARNSHCEMVKITHGTDCTPPPSWQELDLATKQKLANHLLTKPESPLFDEIRSIIIALENTLEKVSLLDSSSLQDSTLKQRYTTEFLSLQHKALAQWKALRDQLEHLSEGSIPLFFTAEAYLVHALSLLEEESFPMAKLFLEHSKLALQQFVFFTLGTDPQEERLIEAKMRAQAIIGEKPLLETSLIALQSDLIQLPSNPFLAYSLQNLELSLAAIKNHQENLAEIFLINSAYQIQRTIRSLQEKEKKPRTILQAAIDDQKNALQITQLSGKINHQPDDLKQLLNDSQTTVLSGVSTFLPAVIAKQKEDYQKHSTCQTTPWNDVIPLFELGNQKAQKASLTLSTMPIAFAPGIEEQKEAIEAWQRALEKLDANENTSEQSPSAPSSSPAKLMQLLEEMEQDDKIQPIPQPQESEIPKPW